VDYADKRYGCAGGTKESDRGVAIKYQGSCPDLKIKFKHFQGHTYDIQEELR